MIADDFSNRHQGFALKVDQQQQASEQQATNF